MSPSKDIVVTGDLFAAFSSQGTPATLRLRGKEFAIAPVGGEIRFAQPQAIEMSEHVAGVPRRLSLPDGRLFVTSAHAELAELCKAAGLRTKGSFIAGAEIWRPRLMAVLAALLIAILVSMRYGLPAAADAAAALVPNGAEATMGSGSFGGLDRTVLSDSGLPSGRQDEIQALFRSLADGARLPPGVALEIRRGGKIGANALAFPGGPILLTDELIALAPNGDALAGVLAHEIAHIEERHGLRRVVRAAGLAMIATVVIGDAGEIIEEMAGIPALLLDRKYSRDFETDADDRAIELMRAVGRDPAQMALMLEALTKTCESQCADLGWLSSHPATPDRVARIRQSE